MTCGNSSENNIPLDLRCPISQNFLKNYSFLLILIFSILTGSLLGFVFKEQAVLFKPLGDIFLNLLFTAVVPLVFFSISSTVASMTDLKRLGVIMGWMILIFILTGIISSLLMILGVKMFPPAYGVQLTLGLNPASEHLNVFDQIVKAITVSDFGDILSRKNMLAWIIFSLLVGLSASLVKEKAVIFIQFLSAGSEVMIKVISLIMLYAPIGLGSYFAYLTGVFGPELMGSYFRAVALYYPIAIFYFLFGFTVYAYLAGGMSILKTFWMNIIPASVTAFATGSSVATIPTNLAAAERIGVPKDIREVVIPIGATIHMDGSCLSAILKIAFLFGIFQMDFSGWGTYFTAIVIALLSGTVMSGIPGGGFIGEVLIVTMYGFPPEALPMISMIGTLVDPPATMVNAVGDNVAGMMLARIMYGKPHKWGSEGFPKV